MSNNTSMPNDWVSSPLTKWLINNNVTLTQFSKNTNLSPNVIYSIVRGQTVKPADKTIQKMCSFTGLSRRQFGFHIRAVREQRVDVDKSVVSRSEKRRAMSKRLLQRLAPKDELTFTITVKESDIPKSVLEYIRAGIRDV